MPAYTGGLVLSLEGTLARLVVAFFCSQKQSLALFGKLDSSFTLVCTLRPDPANPPSGKTRAPNWSVEIDQKFDNFSRAERTLRAKMHARIAEIY